MTEKKLILDYLTSHNTMVLATYGEDGPWSTPLFYVNHGYNIYFLSELTSKHSCNLLVNPLIAASITEDYRDWKEIQGIQLQGKARLVESLKETALVLALYLKKFPAVQHILQAPDSFKGVAKARWHCIEPQLIKFTDNTKKFGERFIIEL